MKRRRNFGGTSLLAVPLCWAWRLRRQTQLRSTASKEGRGSRGTDLTTEVGLENEELLTKNKSQRVTPLLAQRITLTGNSYFWRTAEYRGLVRDSGVLPRSLDCGCHAENLLADRIPQLFRHDVPLFKGFPCGHGALGCLDGDPPQRTCRNPGRVRKAQIGRASCW